MARKPPARIFDVDTNFQRQARRPSPISKQKALAQAQAEIDRRKPEFVNWLGRELQTLNTTIKQAEEHPGASSSVDQAAYHARQLRDVGSTMGYELLTFVAGNLCDILDAIGAGAQYDKESIDCHLDALSLVTQRPYQGLRPEQLPELSRGLRRVFEQLKCSIDGN
jgi:hypothetical protein